MSAGSPRLTTQTRKAAASSPGNSDARRLHPGHQERLADSEFGQVCGWNYHFPEVIQGVGCVERQVPFDSPSGEGRRKLSGEYGIAQSAQDDLTAVLLRCPPAWLEAPTGFQPPIDALR